jgi:phytoene dehydrogenase-like protein
MAAALRLHASGARVTVFDAAPFVGGRTRTDHVDGWRIDPAVQLYSSSYDRFFTKNTRAKLSQFEIDALATELVGGTFHVEPHRTGEEHKANSNDD